MVVGDRWLLVCRVLLVLLALGTLHWLRPF
jgi:hypothetical protein